MLASVLFGLFTVNFTITILTVSIPRIARELDSSQSTLTWVVIGPLLAFGVIGPAVGKLGDLYGQRRIYLLGLAGAAVMAAASAVAWNAPSLISFRLLGAVEGAATGPASFALITSVFPRGQRVKALGYWSMVAAGGPVLGVVAGGPIVAAVGWRAIFAAQVPLTMVALGVAFLVLPETARKSDRGFDVGGAVLLALSATPLLYALNQGPTAGWAAPAVVAGFVVSPLALAGFVLVERRVAQPLLPLHYFGRPNFTFPILVQTLMNAAYMGSFVLTPLLLSNLLGYDEARTGLISAARPLAFSISGVAAGYLAVRVGERVSAMAGAVVLVVAMVWMSTIGVGTSALVIAGGLALAGVALGLASPAMASSVTNAVDEADVGVAGAAQQMMIQIGLVVGIQLMQTVQLTRLDAVGEQASYAQAYLVGSVLAGGALVAAGFVRPTDRSADVRSHDRHVAQAEAVTATRAWGVPDLAVPNVARSTPYAAGDLAARERVVSR